MRYQLLWIWYDGDRDSSLYDSYEEAQEIMEGFKKAFGDQISFICINKVRI